MTTESPPRPDVIKNAIDPRAFYAREFLGIELGTVGDAGWSRNIHCPFHDDQNESFGVNLVSGGFHCFGCGRQGGSVIDFWMERHGTDLQEARLALAQEWQIEPRTPGSKARVTGHAKPPATQKEPRIGDPASIPEHALAERPRRHPHLGTPTREWVYTSADGVALMFVLRFDSPNGKEIRPLTWEIKGGWQWAALPAPRPLYRLAELTARPEARVLVAEGELAADAAAALFPEAVTITTPNGAKAARQSDLSPLRGRDILIWPDLDEPGAAYAREIGQLALEAGARCVQILVLESLAQDPLTGQGRALPAGWDAVDAVAAGWSADAIAKEARWVDISRPASMPTDGQGQEESASEQDLDVPFGYVRRDRGWYWQPQGKERAEFVGQHFKVLAVTRNEAGGDFGRWIEFRDTDNQSRREIVFAREFASSGDGLRTRLAAMGFDTASTAEGRRKFNDLLQNWRPSTRARTTTRTGWTEEGGAYVLPTRVIGEGERVVLVSESGEQPQMAAMGSVEGWIERIGRFCEGNSRLVLAVCCALGGPLLKLANAEGGGFHLRGQATNASSTGKTTAQLVGASVCGPPGYLEKWRSTDNALEGTAELHNDGALFLDELGEMDPRLLGEALYMLAGGLGKGRMDRNGGTRPRKTWRLLILSSGEISVAEHMLAAQKKARAGQEVRLVDVPADAGASLGVFDTIFDFASGAAFANYLTEAVRQVHGVVFEAFISALIRRRAGLPAEIRHRRVHFVAESLRGLERLSGEIERVAGRFGLVAVAGELATEEGLTGWMPGEATRGCLRCFRDWLQARGGVIPAGERDLLRQVRFFFERHQNRFRWKDRLLDDHAPEVPMAAGVKLSQEGSPNSLEYWVFTETMRQEICAGYALREATEVLVKHRILVPDTAGKNSQTKRVPGFEKPQRVYVIRPGHHDEEGD
jgi:putative DNA primase/helicase